MKRKIRDVRVKCILPASQLREFMVQNAIQHKGISDRVSSVGDMINTLHEVHDADVDSLFKKIEFVKHSVYIFGYVALVSIFINLFNLILICLK